MKNNFILDIDQTIIASEELQSFDLGENIEKMRQYDYVKMNESFIVFLRPHLQEFLDFIF